LRAVKDLVLQLYRSGGSQHEKNGSETGGTGATGERPIIRPVAGRRSTPYPRERQNNLSGTYYGQYRKMAPYNKFNDKTRNKLSTSDHNKIINPTKPGFGTPQANYLSSKGKQAFPPRMQHPRTTVMTATKAHSHINLDDEELISCVSLNNFVDTDSDNVETPVRAPAKKRQCLIKPKLVIPPAEALQNDGAPANVAPEKAFPGFFRGLFGHESDAGVHAAQLMGPVNFGDPSWMSANCFKIEKPIPCSSTSDLSTDDAENELESPLSPDGTIIIHSISQKSDGINQQFSQMNPIPPRTLGSGITKGSTAENICQAGMQRKAKMKKSWSATDEPKIKDFGFLIHILKLFCLMCVISSFCANGFMKVNGLSSTFQVCGAGKSGHAIDVPKTVDCKLTHEVNGVVTSNISVYVPRQEPIVTKAYKCSLRRRNVCTSVGVLGSKAVLADIIEYEQVSAKDCLHAVDTFSYHGQKLVKSKAGLWFTNNTLNITYTWCCHDVCSSADNFFIEEGEAAAWTSDKITSNLGDTGGCLATSGNCSTNSHEILVWDKNKFANICPYVFKGNYSGKHYRLTVIIDELQAALKISKGFVNCTNLPLLRQTEQGIALDISHDPSSHIESNPTVKPDLNFDAVIVVSKL